MPNILASGTQRSKFRVEVKVTVHPNDRSKSRTIIIESEIEYRSKYMKSKNWQSYPLMYAQIMYPTYLKVVAEKAIHRLIFNMNLIQFYSSSSFTLRQNIATAKQIMVTGNSQLYMCSGNDRYYPFETIFNFIEIVAPLPNIYFNVVCKQSLKMKLKCVQLKISFLILDFNSKLFSPFKSSWFTIYFLDCYKSCSLEYFEKSHLFCNYISHDYEGTATNSKINSDPILKSLAIILISISISKVPGWTLIRSKKYQPDYLRKFQSKSVFSYILFDT